MSGMRADFHLTGEQRATRDLARQLAREGIAPLAAGVDETESYPDHQLARLGAQGLMGVYIPEAWGGAGLGALAFCLVVEEIAWACAATAVIYLVQFAGGDSPRATSPRRSRSPRPVPVPMPRRSRRVRSGAATGIC